MSQPDHDAAGEPVKSEVAASRDVTTDTHGDLKPNSHRLYVNLPILSAVAEQCQLLSESSL